MKKTFVIIIYIFSLTLVDCANKSPAKKKIDSSLDITPAKAKGLVGEWIVCETMRGGGDSLISFTAIFAQ